jgi:hypothetical protein
MSKAAKTLERVLRGNVDPNIRFNDLCALLKHLGFAMRVRGSITYSTVMVWRRF